MNHFPFSELLAHIKTCVERYPDRIALAFPGRSNGRAHVTYKKATFRQLDQESDRFAHGLSQLGIRRGTRVLFLVPPGLDFITLTLSLLKIGALPVFIDPGMGIRRLLHCIGEVEPEAIIAAPPAHVLRTLSRKYFKKIQYRVTVGRRWFWGGGTLKTIRSRNANRFPVVVAEVDDPLMIGFTTGSTGIPKGVVFHHKTVNAQIRSIRNHLDLGDGDVVLQGFPPFSLRDVAMGLTSVLPKMDPARPAEVDPANVISAITEFGVTHSFGSPAFWGRVAHYCVQRGIVLPSIRKIMLAGAPTSPRVLRELKSILTESADVCTPYGATEALPLTSISANEILATTAHLTELGAGACVGRPLPGVSLRIVKITDDLIQKWDESFVLKPFEIGEIVVEGDVVTSKYFRRPDQMAMCKIQHGDAVAHRMGDVGYLDGENRLWFCGRKNHRVVTETKTLFSIPCEAILNQHKDVFRSALVGIGEKGKQRPAFVIEPWPGRMPRNERERQSFIDELLALGDRNDQTRGIRDVLFNPRLPVDFRHNAKILREKLAVWAARRIR